MYLYMHLEYKKSRILKQSLTFQNKIIVCHSNESDFLLLCADGT